MAVERQQPGAGIGDAVHTAAIVSQWCIGGGRDRRAWTDHAKRTGRCRVGHVRFPFGQFDSGGQHHGSGARPAAGSGIPAQHAGAETRGCARTPPRCARGCSPIASAATSASPGAHASGRAGGYAGAGGPPGQNRPALHALSGQAEMPKGTIGLIRC